MDDQERSQFFFGVLQSYVGSCLFALCCLFAAWLTPRVLRALDWLQARLPRRGSVSPISGLSISTSVGTISKSITPGAPPVSPILITLPELPAGVASNSVHASELPPPYGPFALHPVGRWIGPPTAPTGLTLS